MYTLGQAAKATGKSKSTISIAIKNGKISAAPQGNGSYLIDPSELHRVYPPAPVREGSNENELDELQPPVFSNRTGELEAEAQRLRERLDSSAQALSLSQAERERERQQLTDEIGYLRQSLSDEQTERRKLTAILTDQREKQAMPAASQTSAQAQPQNSPPSGFLGRLVGKYTRGR